MKDHTKLVYILDDSGSMSSLRGDTIGGFNSFVREQKNIGSNADLTTILFSAPDLYKVLYSDKEINDVVDISDNEYKANGGSTALYDAIGKTINDIGEKLRLLEEDNRPNKVLIIIHTDGMENSSKEFSRNDVKTLIDKQKNTYNWEFIFISSDLESVKDAQTLGIDLNKTAIFAKGSEGMLRGFSSVANAASTYRTVSKEEYGSYTVKAE